ncbi:DNA-formamidopyrimidine glycosylase [Desulfosarcina ovata]|uniref:Formamidopyrimidine-DNA glycosylase n=1 Tax=Desulfosarcina ovata subsp. ovata TaxID=2752305 RepID=A0A5K8AC05_9BACT|nr:DNA-formamidopyrimidine glycosylase [Desulfosarcina ovata]BBO90147.1 formamidopyrimidine-DNA glycosylase [Desulfosarcina ovata subsp. ovata]
MPELPEVQTIVDQLNQQAIVGRTITAARVYWPKTIASPDPEQFCETITGLTARKLTRRGKFIVCQLSKGQTLLIHLRMSGRLNWTAKGNARNKHEHVILEIDQTHELRFQDTRKFGRLFLTQAPQTILGRLGPEPLDKTFTGRRFLSMLQRTRRQIKPLLLDQHFLAGLGNIYVDEALWAARIHPLRTSNTLTAAEAFALHRSIRQVLRKGIMNMGTSLGNGQGNFYSANNRPGKNADQLKVFRRTGRPCLRCGTTIVRRMVAQRSSHICTKCQQPPCDGKTPKKRTTA